MNVIREVLQAVDRTNDEKRDWVVVEWLPSLVAPEFAISVSKDIPEERLVSSSASVSSFRARRLQRALASRGYCLVASHAGHAEDLWSCTPEESRILTFNPDEPRRYVESLVFNRVR